MSEPKTTEDRLTAIEANLEIIAKMVRDIALALGVRDRIREGLEEMRGIGASEPRDTEPAPAPAEGA